MGNLDFLPFCLIEACCSEDEKPTVLSKEYVATKAQINLSMFAFSLRKVQSQGDTLATCRLSLVGSIVPFS
jgi:hypothetical protein